MRSITQHITTLSLFLFLSISTFGQSDEAIQFEKNGQHEQAIQAYELDLEDKTMGYSRISMAPNETRRF